MNQNQERFDVGDWLLLIGALALLAGTYLYDWRLSVITAGLLLMVMGLARLVIVNVRGRRT